MWTLCRAAAQGDAAAFSFDAQRTIRVTNVVDGRDLETTSGHTVRLLGVDCSFSRVPQFEDFNSLQSATSYLDAEFVGRLITLEFDRHRVDFDGAILAWAFIDGKSVNASLVANGLATTDFRRPLRPGMKKSLQQAEEEARTARLGIWSQLDGTPRS